MYYLQVECLNKAGHGNGPKDLCLYDCGIKTDIFEFLLLLLWLPGAPASAGPACVCLISAPLPVTLPYVREGQRPPQKAVGPLWVKSH